MKEFGALASGKVPFIAYSTSCSLCALKTQHHRMQWFRDAGLGMFIHWGLYSVLGHGEWTKWREDRAAFNHWSASWPTRLSRDVPPSGMRRQLTSAAKIAQIHIGFVFKSFFRAMPSPVAQRMDCKLRL